MKTLYLLRHFKSSWKDKDLEDFDRPLGKRGRRAGELMAAYVARNGIGPAQILCSPSRRTRETLDRMLESFGGAVPTRFEKGIYLADAPALLRRLRRLGDTASVMIIGHNPGLETLARALVGSGERDARIRLASKFPTGALAVLSANIENWRELEAGCARLDAFVRPRDLESD
jgi:phosphohistidine phosphatase